MVGLLILLRGIFLYLHGWIYWDAGMICLGIFDKVYMDCWNMYNMRWWSCRMITFIKITNNSWEYFNMLVDLHIIDI